MIALCTAFIFSSCGIHTANILNQNSNLTNVELNRKNFVVVQEVMGQSTAVYVLGIGGISNKNLINRAKSEMVRNANLVGTSRAIINVTMENHDIIVGPFYMKRTVTVSGHVIEFTD